MVDPKEESFRKWLFGKLVSEEDKAKQLEVAELLAPFFCVAPSAVDLLSSHALDATQSQAPTQPPPAVDESTRHPRTGSVSPMPAFRQARADAYLAAIAAGWTGDRGELAKRVYGRNNPQNRNKVRSMLHSLARRGLITQYGTSYKVKS